MKKNVSLLQLENNPQIGMYFIVTDDFTLCGKLLKDEEKNQIENILNTPITHFTCYNSEIIGVFMQVDVYTKALYIPNDLYESEFKLIEEICEKHNYSLIQISSTNNAIGNLIASTPNALIISQELKKNIAEIEKKSQKKVVVLENENYHQAGALIYSINSKTLASSHLDDNSLSKIENQIDNITTINNGSAYISSGLVSNSQGILIGDLTTSVEIQTILETLGFLNN